MNTDTVVKSKTFLGMSLVTVGSTAAVVGVALLLVASATSTMSFMVAALPFGFIAAGAGVKAARQSG